MTTATPNGTITAMSDTTDDRPDFQKLQYQFAAHIRDPDKSPAPEGIEDRRMGIYRSLFFNNVSGYLANAFPVIRSLHDEASWEALIRDYYARHVSHGPQFYQIPEEFRDYLENERPAEANDPAFLIELAHFEWVEMKLALVDVDIDWDAVDREGDLVDGVPVYSPLASILEYRFPVHEITAQNQPVEAPEQPTWLAVYRDIRDRVHFMKLNAVTAGLLNLIDQQPGRTGREYLAAIAQQLGHADEGPILEAGRVMLEDFRDRGIVVGAEKRPG